MKGRCREVESGREAGEGQAGPHVDGLRPDPEDSLWD